jgi:glycosyltransferase involved in cell wall biosynthesis
MAYAGNSVSELKRLAEQLADDEGLRQTMSERGRELGRSMFSPAAAAQQIVALNRRRLVEDDGRRRRHSGTDSRAGDGTL